MPDGSWIVSIDAVCSPICGIRWKVTALSVPCWGKGWRRFYPPEIRQGSSCVLSRLRGVPAIDECKAIKDLASQYTDDDGATRMARLRFYWAYT